MLALAGLSTSGVMKFADSIMKTYAASASLIVTLLLSTVIFRGSVSIQAWAGAFLVLVSIFLKAGLGRFSRTDCVSHSWLGVAVSPQCTIVVTFIFGAISVLLFCLWVGSGGEMVTFPFTAILSASPNRLLVAHEDSPLFSASHGGYGSVNMDVKSVKLETGVNDNRVGSISSSFTHPVGSQNAPKALTGFAELCIKPMLGAQKYSVKSKCLRAKASSNNRKNVMPFYNVHAGQSAVLFGNGPTLDLYKHIGLDSVGRHVVTAGVNSIIRSKLPIDYLFLFDKGEKQMRGQKGTGWASDPAAFNDYTPRIAKFYGRFPKKESFGPPIQGSGALQVDAAWLPTFAPQPLTKDIGNFEFGGSASTSFYALQFLLYTGIDHVILVGQDMGGGYYHEAGEGAVGLGHRDTIRTSKEIKSQLRMWNVVKGFMKMEYPRVKMTVVNPIGLKGFGFDESNTTKVTRRK